jgi:hypothetical protein
VTVSSTPKISAGRRTIFQVRSRLTIVSAGISQIFQTPTPDLGAGVVKWQMVTAKFELDWHSGCCKTSMTKTWLHIIAVNLLLLGVLARLRAAVNNHIPLGYQDETGFHFGVQSPRED